MAKTSTVKRTGWGKATPSFRECLKREARIRIRWTPTSLMRYYATDSARAKREIFYPCEIHLVTTYKKEFEAWAKLQQ